MSAILLASIAVRVVALVYSLVVLNRLKDWRLAVITAMIALMALRQCLTAAQSASLWPAIDWTGNLEELPGLGVSVLALLSVYVFGRLMGEQIHERKGAEEASVKLGAIINTAVSAIITCNEKGIIEDFNPSAERMLGYSRGDCLGRNVSSLMPEPYRSGHDGFIARYLAGGKPAIIGIGREVEAVRKDGSRIPIHLSVSEVKLRGRTLFTAMMEDISSRKEAEQRVGELQSELTHVARLSAMGELSSALAHELNQPLTAITNYAETARRLLEQKTSKKTVASASKLLVKAGNQARRAAEVIRRLRQFIVWGESQSTMEDLATTVDEAMQLALIGSAAKTIEFDVKASPDLPKVKIDRIQIQQVVQNLLRNAVDAMEGWAGDRQIKVRMDRASSDTVSIVVEDSGPGLAAEVEEHLFEPFVTTKKQGMGIGLSVCRNIVEAHGGQISGKTKSDGGAIFRVLLPIGKNP